MQRCVHVRPWRAHVWSVAAAAVAVAAVWCGSFGSVAHSQGSLPSGAVADWKFDESSGSTAQDDSGNANHGTLNNPGRVAGRIGGALQFDGVDDHVVVSSPTSLALSNYAISAWVKYTTTDTSGGEIASMGDSFALRVQPSGVVKTFFHAGGSQWPSAVTTVTTNDGAWHHLVGQYDGTKLEIYVDGTLRAQQPVTGSISALGSAFYIGQHANGGSNHNFNGTIDQVRVYGRALSSSEVASLAAEAPAGISFTVVTWNLRKCRGTDTAPGGSDCNRVADALHAMSPQPDIMLLSAVYSSTDAAALQSRLDQLSGATGTWKLHYDRSGGEGQAILTKHTMPNGPGDRDSETVTMTECGGTENQVLVKATVTIGGQNLNVFAVDQQHGSANSTVRACQAAKFRDWANTFAEPRIVGGDFNGSPGDAGITTWLSPSPPAVGYFDGWADTPLANRAGYGKEDATIGNDSSSSIFGRTLRNRIDYIVYRGVTPTSARVIDTRVPGTTCLNLHSSGFLDSCTATCSCTYVDDKGVRPTDHIPLSITFSGS